jgi:FkbM family methyltransferase
MVKRVEGHTFLPSLLDESAVVVDLGANTGGFSEAMARLHGCRCFAVEPTPEIWERIPASARVSKFNLAITQEDGPVSFHVTDNSECSSLHAQNYGSTTRKIEIEGVRLDHFFIRQGLEKVDLLKIDIEGAEFEVLSNLPEDCFQRIGQLLVEFHPGVNDRTESDVLQVVNRIKRAGFAGARMSMMTHADYLFVNRKCALSSLELLSLATIKRYGVYADRVFRAAGRRLGIAKTKV